MYLVGKVITYSFYAAQVGTACCRGPTGCLASCCVLYARRHAHDTRCCMPCCGGSTQGREIDGSFGIKIKKCIKTAVVVKYVHHACSTSGPNTATCTRRCTAAAVGIAARRPVPRTCFPWAPVHRGRHGCAIQCRSRHNAEHTVGGWTCCGRGRGGGVPLRRAG